MLTPTAPSARAIAAAPAVETMLEASSAVSVRRAALTTVPAPSTKAWTLPAILLTTPTPAPLIATPTPPAPSATEPASTVASIVAVLSAVSVDVAGGGDGRAEDVRPGRPRRGRRG